MKINAKELLECLNDVKKAVKKRHIQPYLNCVEIEALASGIGSITGTDLETTVVRKFAYSANTASAGTKHVIDGEMLKKILEHNAVVKQTDEIDINVDDQRLQVVTPYLDYSLPMIDPDQYPDIHHKYKPEKLATVEPALLKTFVASKNKKFSDENPLRSSIIFLPGMVYSTDGHHLFRLETDCTIDAALSSEGAMTMAGLMGDDQLAFAFNHFCYRSEGVEAFVRATDISGAEAMKKSRVDGMFVCNGESVFDSSGTVIEVDRQDFIGSLQRVSVIDGAGVVMETGDDAVSLTARHPDTGEALEICPCVVVGQPLKTMFNPDYMVNGLSAMKDNFVEIRANGPDNQVCYRSGSLSFALMPMRMDGDNADSQQNGG